MNLLQLPKDVLSEIFAYSDALDILTLRSVCKYLMNFISIPNWKDCMEIALTRYESTK